MRTKRCVWFQGACGLLSTLPSRIKPWSNSAVERLSKELLCISRDFKLELRLCQGEWPETLQLVQSMIKNAPSLQRAEIPPIELMTRMNASLPILAFYLANASKLVLVTDVIRERALYVDHLSELGGKIDPVVQEALQENHKRMGDQTSKGRLLRSREGDFALVAKDDFAAGKKLSLHWRCQLRTGKAMKDFVYQVEDLRSCNVDNVYVSSLRFYQNASLVHEMIMEHVIGSETGMDAQCLTGLLHTGDSLMVQAHWCGLSEQDSKEPHERTCKDVPDLLLNLLTGKNAPKHLVEKARHVLCL